MVGTYLKHPDEPAAAFITAPGTQPITWIIDRQGTIREVKLGGQGYEIFAAAVGKYL